MNKQATAFFDVVIGTITFFSLKTSWFLAQPVIETLFSTSSNFTQASVTTKNPGSVINYLFIVLLIAGVFNNAKGMRNKMTALSIVGLLSMIFNHFA